MFLALIDIIKAQDMRMINKLHDGNLSFNLQCKTKPTGHFRHVIYMLYNYIRVELCEEHCAHVKAWFSYVGKIPDGLGFYCFPTVPDFAD